MAFRLPANLAQRIHNGADLGIECDAHGNVTNGFDTGWGGGVPYPPPGYLPWNRLEVGNGDTYGFYWPIGRETEPPLVCTLMHDVAELYPLASSVESAIKLHIAAGMQCDEWQELADDFEIDAGDCEPLEMEIDEFERGGVAPYWGEVHVEPLLAMDPHSPSLLLRRSREFSRAGDLQSSADALVRAVEVLPEYTAAWWELAQLRRRAGAPVAGTFDATINSITSPIAFGHCDRGKCLNWLRSLGHPGEDHAHDPIWQRRDRLVFAREGEDHSDYEVYEQAIAQYHDLGMSIRAVRLRVLYGELMAAETESFLQRKGFTWPRFWNELRQDCVRAGLAARLPALPSA